MIAIIENQIPLLEAKEKKQVLKDYKPKHDIKEMEKLITKHKGKRDSTGRTALSYAAELNDINTAKQLVSLESRVQDQGGRSALMFACKTNNVEIAKLLNNEVQIYSVNGETPLHAAAVFNSDKIISYFIQNDKQFKLLKQQTREGNTALMLASQMGYANIVKELIPFEAKMKNKENRTALMFASMQNHTEVVKLLIQAGESGELSTGNYSALWMACQAGNVDSVKLLLEKEKTLQLPQDGSTPLMIAAEKGHTEVVKYLVENNAFIGIKRENGGATALLLAIANSHKECVDLLMKEQSIKTNLNFTQLMASVNCKDADLTKKFIDQTGQLASNGQCALHFAAISCQCVEIFELLYEKEKDIKKDDKFYAIHLAIQTNNEFAIKWLIEKDQSNITKQILPNFTNTMLAASNNCKYYIENYSQKAGDFGKQEDNMKQTALMQAVFTGNYEIIKLLAKYEIGKQDKDGNTALIIFGQTSKNIVDDKENKNNQQDPKQPKQEVLTAQQKIQRIYEVLQAESQQTNNTNFDSRLSALEINNVQYLKSIPESYLKQPTDKHGYNLLANCLGIKDIKESFNFLLDKLDAVFPAITDQDILMLLASGNRHDLIQIIKDSHKHLFNQLLERQNSYGFTALMFAAQGNGVESAQLLKKQVKKQNKTGVSALMIASSIGHIEMVKFLAQYEIGLVCQQANATALVFAVRNKQYKVINLLEKENTIQIQNLRAVDYAVYDENCTIDNIKQLLKGIKGLKQDYYQQLASKCVNQELKQQIIQLCKN